MWFLPAFAAPKGRGGVAVRVLSWCNIESGDMLWWRWRWDRRVYCTLYSSFKWVYRNQPPQPKVSNKYDLFVVRSLIKKKINFSPFCTVYKEIQSGAVAKSYMRKGFPIYEELRKYFPIYKEAVSHIWLCKCSILNFLIYGEILIFFFISVIHLIPAIAAGLPSTTRLTKIPFLQVKFQKLLDKDFCRYSEL